MKTRHLNFKCVRFRKKGLFICQYQINASRDDNDLRHAGTLMRLSKSKLLRGFMKCGF